jgi:exodeoxyribonuclease V beta subunit
MVGTFVHRVLELVDFAAPELEGALDDAISECGRRDGAVADPTGLASGLQLSLTTALGPLLPGTTLADIGRADRLDELGFELPVAGGETPVGAVSMSDIAGLLGAHVRAGAGGPLDGYAERLLDPLLQTTLRGYLTGSLDLVFRRRRPSGDPVWYLADYKTNWLGRTGGALTVGDYSPAGLDAEMRKRHYPLQALIYAVALHRYLRWRQPGYRPERHLGGVLYLFVRGMAGPGTPAVDGSPCGVWSWAMPPDLIVDLSDLFETGRRGAPA